MAKNPMCEVQNIGPLGIIASIFKEYKIVELIDSLLPKTSNNYKITHGEAILGMVLQGLGFTNHRLYLSAEFFSHVAFDGLFRKGLKAEYFNTHAFSRTLDAIFEYGPSRFFTDSCLKTIMENKLLSKLLFIDTTSFHATGKKYKGDGNLELKHGHSKDYRMDLKQLVYLLATTDEGLPILAEAHSGNTSDGDLFQETIIKIQDILKDQIDEKIFVLDSSLYNKKFLLNDKITGHWITRVPESVKMCKSFIETDHNDDSWTKVDIDFKYLEKTFEYGGKKQRWILVRNRKSKYKEIDSFKSRTELEENKIKKSLAKHKNKVYQSKDEARCEVDAQKKYHQNFDFSSHITGVYKRVKGSKRKIKVGFKLHIKFSRNEQRIKNCEMRKGKFVLATDCLDQKEMSSEAILAAYRSRNKGVEGCFKFLKDRQNNFNQIFLKSESRIEAMIMVMSLTLFVNNLAQKKLRDHLEETKETIPTQTGRQTSRPTFQWASYLMRHVTKVKIKVHDVIHDEVKGIKKAQETIIRAFGSHARQIYGLV